MPPFDFKSFAATDRAGYDQQQADFRQQELDSFADTSWLGGFVESGISSIGEMFGADPSNQVQQFRLDNPVSGLVSELVGTSVPYAGMWKLANTAKGIALTEQAMTSLPGLRKLSAVDTPISYGAAKMTVQFSPLELSRLGIGWGTTEEPGDYGNLLADVGLSVALTGGFGAAGGFFRSLGKRAPEVGSVVGADLGWQPTFQLRMLRAKGEVTGEISPGDMENLLLKEVYMQRAEEVGGKVKPYVEDLEGGTPQDIQEINALFKPSGGLGKGKTFRKQPFMDSRTGLWVHDDAERARIAAAAGFKDMTDMAEHLVQPRLIQVDSGKSAGRLASILENNSAMKYVGENVWMGRQPNNGLFVMMKRLKAGKAPDELDDAAEALREAARALDPDVKMFGSAKVAEGDEWLIAMTDKPQRLAPKAHKAAEMTVEQWAKMRPAWQPSRAADVFTQRQQLFMDTLHVGDWRDLRSGTRKQTMLDRWNQRATEKLLGETGLKGSAVGSQMADTFWQVVKPAIHQENRNPLYQRLWALLRHNFVVAQEMKNTIIGGAVKVAGNPVWRKNRSFGEGFDGHRAAAQAVRELDNDELQLLARIGQAQLPMNELAKVSKDGLVSERLKDVIATLQGINRSVWDKILFPTFKAAEVPVQFELLEGYFMPRMFKGDWFVPVLDKQGKTAYLASGKRGQAIKEAEAVVEEAKKRGLNWAVGAGRESHLSQQGDLIGDVGELVTEQMARSKDAQEAVSAALKRIEIERYGGRKGEALPGKGLPRALTKERSGVSGTPDTIQYTAEDIIKSMEDHYDKLLRFAALKQWQHRFLPEAMNLGKLDPSLYQDLLKKSNQLMGIPGELTKVLDRTLSPVLGGALGGRAATKIAAATNEMMYLWNIGIANPTQAILNLLTPLQTVAPWIAFMTSKAPALAKERMMLTSLRFGADGRPNGTMSVASPIKILWQSMKEMGSPDEALMAAYGRAKTDATLTPQMYEGFVGGQSRHMQTLREAYKDKGGGIEGGWEFIKRTSTVMFEKSEEFSRMHAFTSAWIVGRDFFGLADEALYQFAKRGTHVTMYGYSAVDRARMFTGPVGSMFGLFKNWQWHFIGGMAQYARLGVQEGIWEPMLWQFGAALAVGGVGATPLKWAADGLASWAEGSPDSFLWMKENWNDDAADFVYFGLPAMFGGSLQASAAIPGTDVRNDLSHMMNFVIWDRAKQAGLAVGAAFDYAGATDQNALSNPNVRDQLMSAFAPRAMFRALAAAEGDYIKSMRTGYPQVRDVGPAARLLYGLGINPIEIEQHQIAARELWKDQEKRRTILDGLGNAYAQAHIAGRRDEQFEIAQRAVALGIPLDSLAKSVNTRLRRELEGDIMSRYDKAQVEKYVRAFED